MPASFETQPPYQPDRFEAASFYGGMSDHQLQGEYATAFEAGDYQLAHDIEALRQSQLPTAETVIGAETFAAKDQVSAEAVMADMRELDEQKVSAGTYEAFELLANSYNTRCKQAALARDLSTTEALNGKLSALHELFPHFSVVYFDVKAPVSAENNT